MKPTPRAQAARWLACLLSAAAAVLVQAADPKASQYYEDAQQRFDKNDIAGAIVQLRNALKSDRKLLQGHLLLAKALRANGELAAAEAAFEEAVRLGVSRAEVAVPWAQTLLVQGKVQDVLDEQKFPLTGLPSAVRAELLTLKAGAHGDLGDAKAALKLLADARAADPTLADGWLGEVPIRIRRREFKEAQAAIEGARTADPRSPQILESVAALAHAKGDTKAALQAYDAALQAEPKLTESRAARAALYFDLQRFEDAARDADELLRLNPSEPRGQYVKSLLAEQEGKSAQAKAHLLKITQLIDPLPLAAVKYRPQLLMLNGQAHYALGEREKAKPYFEAFARQQPGTPVSKLLGTILLQEGNTDRAIEVLEEYIAASGEDPRAVALLASAYRAKGRNGRAAELMQRALKRSDAPELYSAYGLSLMALGQRAEATAQLETAYRKDPKQEETAAALASLYLQAGRPDKAVPLAQTLVKQRPKQAGYHDLLGVSLAAKSDIAGARAAFEQALTIDAGFHGASINLARLEQRAGNVPRARQLLGAVLKADPLNTNALREVAAQAELAGNVDEALRQLQRATDIAAGKDLRPAMALADLQIRTGRAADAVKTTKTLSATAPESLPVAIAHARALINAGDRAGAKAPLTIANRLAPIEAPVQVEIALLQLAAGNVPGAAYAVTKALEANPKDLRAQALEVDVLVHQAQFDKAQEKAQALTRQQPKLALGFSLLGDIALARRQPPAAVEHYRHAHQVQPSAQTARSLFTAQASLNAKQGMAFAEQWLKQYPGDASVRRLLAQAYVKTGNWSAARGQYETLLAAAPSDTGAANDLANVLMELNDPKALEVAEKALALNPGNPNLSDTAGWIAYRVGKNDRALQLLREARLRAPESPVVRLHLAAALMKADRRAEALDEVNAVLRDKAAASLHAEADRLRMALR